MPRLQNIIHEIDAGIGKRYLWYGILAIVLVLLAINYNSSGFKNMSNPEAMDAAQLARNLAEGNGYKTFFVRPLSIYLAQKAAFGTNVPTALTNGLSSEMQPDLSNPPVYPLVLAGLMKVFPGMRYQNAGHSAVNIGTIHLNLWNNSDHFWIYGPDFWISLFNQLIFLGTTTLLFFFARKLFDSLTALVSALIFLGTDLLWHFSISGLSTMLLILIFLGLAQLLTTFEFLSRESKLSPSRELILAGLIGLLTGVGCLTRYSFGWLILPVAIFLLMFAGPRRYATTAIAVLAFMLVVVPWMVRNYHLSHALFGTAGYAPYSLTYLFPEYRLERAINPDFGPMNGSYVWHKFLASIQAILQDDLPRLGGTLATAFFLVGLLIQFKSATLNRLRFFLLLSLVTLIIAQALGRTQLSVDSPVVNSENLLVLLTPLVIVFGVSLFFSLLDQMVFPIPSLRQFIIVVFYMVLCEPAITAYFNMRTVPIAYPPYYPPVIQKTSDWMRPDELVMSDIPWAVAWYGRHQAVWLTDNAKNDFYDLNHRFAPVKAVYLSPVTMDAKYLTQGVWTGENSWGAVALNIMLKGELPEDFPLKRAPVDFLPEQMFLTDSERWGKKTIGQTNAP